MEWKSNSADHGWTLGDHVAHVWEGRRIDRNAPKGWRNNRDLVTHTTREDAMSAAERNIMGWKFSQFSIDGYVLAEVRKPKKARRDGMQWTYDVGWSHDPEYFMHIWEAYQAAEKCVRLKLEETCNIGGMSIGRYYGRRRTASLIVPK